MARNNSPRTQRSQRDGWTEGGGGGGGGDTDSLGVGGGVGVRDAEDPFWLRHRPQTDCVPR